MAVRLSESVTQVAAAAEKLRADDRLITATEVQLADLEAVLSTITTLQAVVVRRLRAVRDSGATVEWTGRSPKRWLVEEQLLAAVEASRYLRLVYALPDRPEVTAAFDAAQITAAHAAAICSALKHLPPDVRELIEPHLVDRARSYPPEEISGFVDELLDTLGVDKASDLRRERRHAERGFDLTPTFDRTRHVTGSLTPEVAEQVEAALALAGQPGGADDTRGASQRRHDALGVIAAAFLHRDQTPSFTGAPRTIIVTIPLETLRAELTDQQLALTQRWLTLPSGAQISAATARRLACDAELIPVVLGTRSEVLDIGQADHEFTTAIRRAAWIRDGGHCAFPACRNTILELHHIIFRRHAGPTSLDNAAWLCGFHHWLVHEGGWTLQRQPHDHSYQWTSPHGTHHTRQLPTARHLPTA